MKLIHNQRFEKLRILTDNVSFGELDMIVWIDETYYSFARYGENLPIVLISTEDMNDAVITEKPGYVCIVLK